MMLETVCRLKKARRMLSGRPCPSTGSETAAHPDRRAVFVYYKDSFSGRKD
jgi:hypothetical protein